MNEHLKPNNVSSRLAFEDQTHKDSVTTESGKRIRFKDLKLQFNSISSFFFEYLLGYNLPVSFHSVNEDSSLKMLKGEDLPFIVRFTNINAEPYASHFGREPWQLNAIPHFQILSKADTPVMLNESIAVSYQLAGNEELKVINRLASKVNAVLKSFFERRQAALLSVDISFTRWDERLFISGQLSPLTLAAAPVSELEHLQEFTRRNDSASMKTYTEFLMNLTQLKPEAQ